MSETKTCPYCGEEILAAAKKCKHCGEWLEEKKEEPKRQVPCEICGEMIDEDATVCPYCHEKVITNEPEVPQEVSQPVVEQKEKPQQEEVPNESKIEETIENIEDEEPQGVFVNYFLDVIRNHYSDFSRSVTRKEYWLFVLFNTLVSWALMCLAFLSFPFALVISIIYSLGVLVPSLAMAVGRLRDIDKEWTNLFFALIPIVGPIILLVFLCREGEKRNFGTVKMAIPDYVIIVLAIVGIIALTRAQAQMMSALLGDYEETSSFSQLLNTKKEKSYILKMPDMEAIVAITSEQANLRTGPSTDYTKYGEPRYRGEALVAFEQQDSWWHVYTNNDNTAWISSSVTKVVDSGSMPIERYGVSYYANIMDNFVFYKLTNAGKYNGCVLCYVYKRQCGDNEDDSADYEGTILLGESTQNGIILPYEVKVIVRTKTPTSDYFRITIASSGEFVTTIPGKMDDEYDEYWVQDPTELSELNENTIDLLLSKATYSNNALVLYNVTEE